MALFWIAMDLCTSLFRLLGGALCFVGLKGGFVRRFEKWGESVGGSIGCEVWGQGGASDFVLCLGVWCCVGRYFGFGFVFGVSAWDWEVLCVLDCV